MPTEPNTPQPLIPFKMPHLTPVLDAPSPLVPESAAFMNFQIFQTEKANLEFMPVKFRTQEHRARLVIVKAQCEELEKQVMLERMVAQIAQLRQEIKALARPRKQGRKPGQKGARIRKQRLADREVLAAKQAELSKLEAAHAKLSGIPTVAELHELTRNQFLKMVGLTVLATVIWNRAAAAEFDGGSSWTSEGAQVGSQSCASFASQGTGDVSLINGERVDAKVTYGQFDRPDDVLAGDGITGSGFIDIHEDPTKTADATTPIYSATLILGLKVNDTTLKTISNSGGSATFSGSGLGGVTPTFTSKDGTKSSLIINSVVLKQTASTTGNSATIQLNNPGTGDGFHTTIPFTQVKHD